MKRYDDHERPLPPNGQAACYDCRLPYGAPAWCDVIVPDDVWEQINPTHHRGAGLLCFNCIASRCIEAGLSDVPLKITSGPFEAVGPSRTADGVPLTRGMTIYVLNDVLGMPFHECVVNDWDNTKIYYREPNEHGKVGCKSGGRRMAVFASRQKAEKARQKEADDNEVGCW